MTRIETRRPDHAALPPSCRLAALAVKGSLLPLLIVAISTTTPAAGDEPRPLADRILRDAGVAGGLVVHLGCGDGRLTAALRLNERYRVHGLDADSASVAAAREHVATLPCDGVFVDRFDGRHLPYAENLVNLIVAEALGEVSMDEVRRVLVPHGVAYVKTNGRWMKTVKPWPARLDEWTHWLHAADGNAVAGDMVA
ncbi:MAG: methyltransferase domain-containing protein, partial [Planctomycetota bacterium]